MQDALSAAGKDAVKVQLRAAGDVNELHAFRLYYLARLAANPRRSVAVTRTVYVPARA